MDSILHVAIVVAVAVLALAGLPAATPSAALAAIQSARSGLPAAFAPSRTTAPASTTERFEFVEPHMGTEFRLVFYAPTAADAESAAEAAFAQVARLDSLFSDYRGDSEIAGLAARSGGEWVSITADLWMVLDQAQRWSVRTDGAFDVTIGPLTQLWRWSARRGELPDPDRLETVRAEVGFRMLRLHPTRPAVALDRPGMALDLGGIAKGFAADRALAVLARRGIDSALVDAGGDLRLGEPPPGEEGWSIALPDAATVFLANVGVASSGDQFRFVEVGETRYSHVVDPRTGLGVQRAPVVSVIAPDATTADVMSSALTVMDSEDGKRLVYALDGVSARVIGTSTWTSDDFSRPRERPRTGESR